MPSLVLGLQQWAYAQTEVSANDLKPMMDSFAETKTSYKLTRCAAVFYALSLRTGEKKMGKEGMKQNDAIIIKFWSGATTLLMGSEGITDDLEQAYEIVGRDTQNIANLYVERFHSNYAETGHAFAMDEVFMSDFNLCQMLLKSNDTK
ncbi:MAG: hypothetical protein HRU27_10010 [Rhizobiaceae bacterium]|nr:hypothetical protein [Hyphomicrobiales bacterium]NRB30917.1 hypothetical protein [Rhizobiaceae bacterium]